MCSADYSLSVNLSSKRGYSKSPMCCFTAAGEVKTVNTVCLQSPTVVQSWNAVVIPGYFAVAKSKLSLLKEIFYSSDLGYMWIIALNLCVSGRTPPPNRVVVACVVKCSVFVGGSESAGVCERSSGMLPQVQKCAATGGLVQPKNVWINALRIINNCVFGWLWLGRQSNHPPVWRSMVQSPASAVYMLKTKPNCVFECVWLVISPDEQSRRCLAW